MARLPSPLLSLAFASAALGAGSAAACDLCSVFVSERAQGTSSTAGAFQGGISEQYTHFGTLRDEGTKIENDANQYLNSSNTQVFFSAALSPELSLQLNFPVLRRTFRRATDAGTEEGSETGVGDVSILAKFLAYDRDTANGMIHAVLLGGLKLPTGSTARLREELAEDVPAPDAIPSGIHGHDLTLGSGSTDVIVGGAATVTSLRFVLPASVQYAYRTRGRYAYRFANDFAWQVAPGYYALLDHARSGIVALSFSGELKGEDDFDGATAADTGMKSVFIGPQFVYTAGDSLSISAGVDFPIVSKNTALQIVPDSRIRLSLTARL